MKHVALAMVVVVGLIPGCATGSKGNQPKPAAKKTIRLNQTSVQAASTNAPIAAPEKKPVATAVLDTSLAGKVLTYNSAGRFVVLDFPIGKMPALDATMQVYRAGKKIGAIKITGPSRENSTVADLIDGEAGKGDEVREP